MLKSLPLAGKNKLSSLIIRIAAVEECESSTGRFEGKGR